MCPIEIPYERIAGGMSFGEAPRYHEGLLYVSDMLGRKIYTIEPSSGKKTVLLEVENQPNGMCFHPDGSLIYSSMFDAKLFRFQDGKSTLYSDLSQVMTGYCGDMDIDKSGRMYVDDVGARVLHGEKPKPGRLLLVETDGSAKVAAENLMFPNALMVSNDGKTLFVAETFGYGLQKFDVGPEGELCNRRDFWSPLSLPGAKEKDAAGVMVKIDGGCMDAKGGIWLSMLGYKEFIRIDDQGQLTHRIKVDGHATACELGGDDGKTLFMVINEVPEGGTIFEAMMAKKTSCIIGKAKVPIS
ncbi:Fc.00g056630.m01.CDS01 [Cosmosporella sp. VM-42]